MDCSPDVLCLSLASDLSSHVDGVSYLDLCCGNRDLWPDISPREVACLALQKSLLSKLVIGTTQAADRAALALFLEANNACKEWDIDATTLTERDAIFLGEFEQNLYDSLEDPIESYRNLFDIDSISLNGDIGPGASILATGTSHYHKVCNGPMSTTSPSLYALYRRLVNFFPLERDVELHRSSQWGEFVEVQGSKLAFVPKKTLISRVICTEPFLNMFFQKGLAAGFEQVLDRSFGIDLTIQPDKNRELARIGSIDGSYGTIDLTSASDTISFRMIKRFFPKRIIGYMNRFRSPVTVLPSGSTVELHMVSSMGNAFTFPLQTLIFSCAVKAVYKVMGIPILYPRGKNVGNFSVFGDDIIVRREAYDFTIRVLKLLGFIPNVNKSFNEGLFRESCGHDYYRGTNVRGVYAKDISTPQKIYTLINRLQIWSANHDVPLPETIRYLSSLYWVIPVPPWDNIDSGIFTPLKHAMKVRVAKPERFNGSTLALGIDGNDSILYYKYAPRILGVSMVSVGQRPFLLKKIKGKKTVCQHNHAGILLSAIGGKLRSGNLSQRMLSPRYYSRLCIAPCWDYIDAHQSDFTHDGWHRWVTSDVHLASETVK